MLSQSSRLEVAVSPAELSVGISPVKAPSICEGSPSRVGIDIPSKSKTVVSPQSVGGAYPQQFLERIGCKGGFLSKGCLFPAAVLFPSRVESEY